MTTPACQMLTRSLLRGVRQSFILRQQCRTIWNSKKEFDRDLLVKIQKDYDLTPTALFNYLQDRRWNMIKKDHQYDRERHEFLGSELSAAHFIVTRGGMVKAVDSDKWVKMEEDEKTFDLPMFHDPSWKLEGIEKGEMIFIYDSFSNLVNLEHLKYLSLRGGKHIDDWCLDALVSYRDTLIVLDISECANVTEKGLGALSKLKKLRRLKMYNMTGIKNPGLVLVMLEDMLPNVFIETDIQYSDQLESLPEPELLQDLKEQDAGSFPGIIKDLELNMRTHSKSN